MSEQLARRIPQHEAATLPPSHEKFKHLDSLLIALDEQPGQPRRIALQLRKRWIERNVPAYTPQAWGGK